MKKFIFGAVAATFLFAAPMAAQAETKDVAKTTCQEFMSDKDDMPLLIMWIDGYLSAQSDNTVFSKEWQEKLGSHLGEFCTKNPNKTIMDAMDALPDE